MYKLSKTDYRRSCKATLYRYFPKSVICLKRLFEIILSGKTYPSLNRLSAIAKSCNVLYCWLATGYELDDIDNEKVYNEYIHRISVYEKQMPSIEEVRAQKYVRGSPPTMNYPVLDGWASYRGVDVKKLIIYWAKGELMAPEIKNNNGLIINTDMGGDC